MSKLVKAYRPDGTARCVYSDRVAAGLRAAGVPVHRASDVEPVLVGPHFGLWHVDLSPLADVTGDERFRVCLTRVFERRGDALAAEVAWIEREWVLQPPGATNADAEGVVRGPG